MKNLLTDSTLSLEDLEGTENDALNRIVSSLNGNQSDVTAHMSHSSSTGRGHMSYVTGTGHSEQPENK